MFSLLLYSRRLSLQAGLHADRGPDSDSRSHLYQHRHAQGWQHNDTQGASSSRSRLAGARSPRAGHHHTEVRASWSDYGVASTRHAEVLNVRKPPGLSCKALCCLQQEVFRESEQTEMSMRELLECCICLERFQEGDKLSKLRCGHKFHQCCLEPWVRTCGDCPYCRAFVVVE